MAQIQDRGRHPINQKTSCGNSINLEMLGHLHLKQYSLSGFKKVSIFSFSNSILRSNINTRYLMKDIILKHELLKLFRHIFFDIITSHILNRNLKLSVNFSIEDTKVRK